MGCISTSARLGLGTKALQRNARMVAVALCDGLRDFPACLAGRLHRTNYSYLAHHWYRSRFGLVSLLAFASVCFCRSLERQANVSTKFVAVAHHHFLVVGYCDCLARRWRPVGQSTLPGNFARLAISFGGLRLVSLPFAVGFLAGANLVDRGNFPGFFHAMVLKSLLPHRGAAPFRVDGCFDYREQPDRLDRRRFVGSFPTQRI